jgi:hypothetical protein
MEMASFCGNCGSPLNGAVNFCGVCGARATAAAPTPAPTTFTPTPVAAPDAGFSPVPEAFPNTLIASPNPTELTSVPAEFPLAPVTPSETGFTSVPAAWIPPPVPRAAPSTPINAGYSPVIGATEPASVPYMQAPAAYVPTQAPYTPVATAAAPLNAYPAAKQSNTLVKLVVAFVLFIFVVGALAIGGLWYAARKIKAKADTVAAQLRSTEPSASNGFGGPLSHDGESIKGDPCRFLSKAEVSRAVGLPIIRTEAHESGCSYIAKGDPADGTAKHLSSMLGHMGADAQTQKLAEKFAGGLFAQQEVTDKSLSAEAAKEEFPVLVTSFSVGHAVAEMRANRGAFEHLKGDGEASNAVSTDLSGIGDEAYVAGGGILLLRKHNVLARMTYINCPCNTDNIKPLARNLAARL